MKIYNEPIDVLMFDINNLKKINDSYGHDVGDLVLIEFDNNRCFNVIPSVGIANYPKDGKTLEEVIISADRRMYEDKELGKMKIESGT